MWMAIASAAISAVGAMKQGQATKDQADYQAKVLNQQADYAKQTAGIASDDFLKKQDEAFATRRANMGRSGVDSTTGSPLMVSEDFAGEAALQALRIRNGGDVTATRLEQTASLQTLAGKNAQEAGYFNALGSLGRSAMLMGGGGGAAAGGAAAGGWGT